MVPTFIRWLAVVFAVVASPAQVQPQGVLTGRVVARDTKTPLAAATVRIERLDATGGATPALTKTTGEKGEFSFDQIAPGRYYVSASKPRYLTLAYGQKPGSGLPGVSIVVNAGQRVGPITVELPITSVIAGVVRDERGEPAMNAYVSALRLEWRNGERAVRLVARDVVDDRGMYRIPNLPPGDFIIVAGRSVVAPATTSPVYYPGTAIAAQALPITLGVSDERAGVDMAFQTLPLASISGQVVGPDEKPLANIRVSIEPRSQLKGLDVKGTYSSARGEFVISSVTPGPYKLTGWAERQGSSPASWAEHDVVLDTAPVRDIRLVMRAGATVSGLVKGLAAASGATVRITLNSLDRDPENSAVHWGRSVDDGQFSLSGVAPGRYTVSVGELPKGYAVASVRLSGRDVHDLPFEIAAAENVRGLEITLTTDPTTVSGLLQDQAGAPAPDYLVVLFAEEERYWSPGTTRIRADRPANNGRYEFTNVPPGSYRLGVVTDAEPGEWFVPDFLRRISAAAMPITVTPGQASTLNLRVK